MELDARIEAYLFYTSEPEKVTVLARFFEVTEDEVRDALTALRHRLTGGITLIEHDDAVSLMTHAAVAQDIEKLRKEDVMRDLGRAGLETLSIIIYKGPVTRTEIDYIRGVNSSYILRNLMVRGLIKRTQAGKGAPVYAASIELLAHLGIASLADMPEYGTTRDEIAQAFIQETAER